MTSQLKLQLAGLPLSAHRRVKADLDGWAASLPVSLRLAPSQKSRMPAVGKEEFAQICANVQDGFVHIAAVPSRDVGPLAKKFSFSCRVVRLSLDDPVRVTSHALIAQLTKVIEFESQWMEGVRPRDLGSPLILPCGHFVPSSVVQRFWSSCDCYWRSDALEAAKAIIGQVRQLHSRSSKGISRYWVDSQGLCFHRATAFHGRSLEERRGLKRFRFCFEVPPGFHFDVCRTDARPFTLADRSEMERANIDPWGFVRPGGSR